MIVLLWLNSFVHPVHAIEINKAETTQFKKYKGLAGLILSPERIPPNLDERPRETDEQKILSHTPITHFNIADNNISLCHEARPHSHQSFIKQAGYDTRLAAAHAADHIETITIQPKFSGLLGPSITFLRRDFENALRDHKGSRAEIIHNAHIAPPLKSICGGNLSIDFDLEYKSQIDAFYSDEKPLHRTDVIAHTHMHVGQYFLASLGLKAKGFNNLATDDDLIDAITRNGVSGKDLAFAERDIGLHNLSMHGFFTIKPYLYAAAHGGYLEERLFGLGGELLYRPFAKPWALGFDLWGAAMRDALSGDEFKFRSGEQYYSAFINGWYDFQSRPVSLGLSLGRFLDGDYGAEVKAIYKPSSGWRFEGFTRYSNEKDQTTKNDNITAGLRLTVPLEQIKGHPSGSRLTTEISPFGESKRQRVHNNFSLYDLTDTWSAQNIYQNWDDVIE
jgi:hypothetical protein